MSRAGSRVGARCWSGMRVERVVAASVACPPFTSLTSSTPALEANPTRRLGRPHPGGSSQEQQSEKGRKR